MNDKVFYITTPIYYVNDLPHVGNSSTTVASDVIARFKRLQGHRVLFATGTDEHAIKVAEVAKSKGMSPREFVDGIVPQWKEVWRQMKITYDDFIRTPEPRHKKVVEEAFTKLLETGDIYKDVYKGWYCISDETFFREAEVVDGKCPNPECRREVSWVEEENYFFRLSAYGGRLLEYIEANPDFLRPDFRRNEVVSFIKAGLKDACITRKAYGWGIPVPGDPAQVIYVWFDALLNYLTVAGYLSDEEKFARVWPADIQLMAKDIFVRFHCTLWPAMLMGLGLPLPRKIFGHGYWTMNGEKMSKSRGNVISPAKAAEDLVTMSGAEFDIAMDAVRYFLMREVTFGLDGDFSMEALAGRFNSDLANDLGNLLNRTLPLLHNYRGGVVPEPAGEDPASAEIRILVESTPDEVAGYLDELRFSEALGAIWTVIGRANKYMEGQAPWKLAKDEACAGRLNTVLYTVLEAVRATALLIAPFMPSTAESIWGQLGVPESLSEQKWSDAGNWGRLQPGTQTRTPKPIFPRIDMKAFAVKQAQEKEKKMEEAKEQAAPEQKEEQYLSFDDFKKVELKIGKVISAERVEGANKLLKLMVDIGTEQRQVIAGIAQYYEPESLAGKLVVVVANLAPAKIRGVESRGMLLAADVEGRAILLTPDQEVPPGSGVR